MHKYDTNKKAKDLYFCFLYVWFYFSMTHYCTSSTYYCVLYIHTGTANIGWNWIAQTNTFTGGYIYSCRKTTSTSLVYTFNSKTMFSHTQSLANDIHTDVEKRHSSRFGIMQSSMVYSNNGNNNMAPWLSDFNKQYMHNNNYYLHRHWHLVAYIMYNISLICCIYINRVTTTNLTQLAFTWVKKKKKMF